MYTIDNIRSHIIGINQEVEIIGGRKKQYIYFDNAASTPAIDYTYDKIGELLELYSGVHRGAGIKSIISTQAYDDAHEIMLDFFKYDKEVNTAICVKNTTEAINKLSYRLDIEEAEFIITSHMEHHSNFLPWRKHKNVEYVDVNDDGSLNLDDLYAKIDELKGKLRLVAVTGASNVSGIINPIYEIAEKVHEAGAQIFVDAAQLAPHKRIDARPEGHPEHLDFLAFSGHKMYAPYGTGVLIGPKSVFLKGDPEYVGGGMAKAVTMDRTIWHDLPDKEEAGSPNVLGAVGIAAAMKVMEEIGWDDIEKHEEELTEYIHEKMDSIPEIELSSKLKHDGAGCKVGVVSFNIKDIHYELVSAILCYEGAFGVRAGCFCAQPYIKKVLNITEDEANALLDKLERNERVDLPGALRVSFGIYSTKEEVDEFIVLIKKIIRGDYEGSYEQDPQTGKYVPEGFELNYNKYFTYEISPKPIMEL